MVVQENQCKLKTQYNNINNFDDGKERNQGKAKERERNEGMLGRVKCL